MVVLFMLVYYRGSGVNAVVALLLNMILMLAGLVLFQATLTLPGIAGIILTIGMAVDSNVLIFERIREELRTGKTIPSAIEQGFARAFVTIIDTHVTTTVSSLFLFVVWHGSAKGFRSDTRYGPGDKSVLSGLCFAHNFHVGIESQKEDGIAEYLKPRQVSRLFQSLKLLTG